MKRLLLVGLSLVLVAGCGKKKNSAKNEGNHKNKIVATADEIKNEIPLYTTENEELFDKNNIVEFAFADENEPNDLVASADQNDKDDEFSMPLIDDNDADTDLLVENENAQDEDNNLEFKRIQFALNKNTITQDQKAALSQDIEAAKKAVEEGKKVVVQGHTCQLGSAGFNLALSQRRAEAVKKEMVKNGLPESSIKTLGMGNESPLVWTEETDKAKKIEALSPNRRAEIVIEETSQA